MVVVNVYARPMLLVPYGRIGIYLAAGNIPACGSCRWTGHEKAKYDPDRGMTFCPEMQRWVDPTYRCTHYERAPGTD
jgi:hypothetical protein